MKVFVILLISTLVLSCKDSESNCISEEKPQKACYYIYDPVCGCDGKTYGNSCEADVNGVISYSPGACPN